MPCSILYNITGLLQYAICVALARHSPTHPTHSASVSHLVPILLYIYVYLASHQSHVTAHHCSCSSCSVSLSHFLLACSSSPPSGPIARRALEMLSTIPWYVQYPNRRLKRITYAYRKVDPTREGYEHLAEEWKQCRADEGKAPHSLLPYKQAADHNGNGKLDAKHAGLYWCIKTRAGSL